MAYRFTPDNYKFSPDTLNIIKMWVTNTPPTEQEIIKIQEEKKIIEEKKILTPETYGILKSWIEKTPPSNMFKRNSKNIEKLNL